MISVGFAKIFDSKIVDCKREVGTTLVVTPKASRREANRCVTVTEGAMRRDYD